ncbi:MAG: hypothetical protein JWR06_721 [Jatrophihabitans sp.]|jgi:uncharacterized integral membrane protein|nr:hypothetical protein [Jatrophihabitans sp.]MDT4901655.1 hypothetical protein [Pseudonocardiales bacterium]
MSVPGQPPYGQQPYPQQPDPSGAVPPAQHRRKVSTGQILGGLLLVLVVVFIIENSRTVKIRLIIPEVRAPLYVGILIAAVLGGLIASLLQYRRHRKHQ